jgi:hypothetical protein
MTTEHLIERAKAHRGVESVPPIKIEGLFIRSPRENLVEIENGITVESMNKKCLRIPVGEKSKCLICGDCTSGEVVSLIKVKDHIGTCVACDKCTDKYLSEIPVLPGMKSLIVINKTNETAAVFSMGECQFVQANAPAIVVNPNFVLHPIVPKSEINDKFLTPKKEF